MEVTEDVDVIPELITEFLELPDKDLIDNCLSDFHDPPKPAKGKGKKTMEKRTKERMSFKHVVDKATVSNVENHVDFSSMSSFTSVDSDFSPPSLERKKNIDNPFLKYRFRGATMSSKSKYTKGIVKGQKSGYSMKLPKMKRIYSKTKKDVPTASTSREYNLFNFNKTVLGLKCDELELSKSDDVKNLDHLVNVVFVDLPKQKTKKSLLQSKSAKELRRIYEDDKSENKEDLIIPSTGKRWIVSNEDKKILLSSNSDKEESKSNLKDIANNVIEDVETPSTSKYINVSINGLGGVKRIPERDEGENSKSRKERNFIDGDLNVVNKTVLRRKKRVSAKTQEVSDNAHIYNFFSSMADLVSTLPYSTTLTAKERVTKILTEMVERVDNLQRSRPVTTYDISDEDMKLIKLRLSMLRHIY